MIRKKGAANVEFILAFILFIGFLMAVLYFFNPIKDVQSIDSSKDYIFNEIKRRAGVDIDSYSIIFTAGEDAEYISIDISDFKERDKNVRVEDYYGVVRDSRKTLSSLCFERERRTEGLEGFIVIRFSEDYASELETCSGTGAEYKVASSIEERVLSVKGVRELRNSYDSDYGAFKDELDIPRGVDFSFSLELDDGELVGATREAALRVEVYSETRIIEVLNEDGTSGFAHLKVSAW